MSRELSEKAKDSSDDKNRSEGKKSPTPKNGWIRKSGWLVALVFVGSVSLLAYLFASSAIRSAMVYGLQKVTGAEVNIGSVSLGVAPLSIAVKELQLTDANNPTHNTVSFSSAQAGLEVWPALLGYYIIDDLSVEGFTYGAERTSPGKVFAAKAGQQDDAPVDFESVLKLDIPNAQELLERANLQTPEKGELLKEKAKVQKEALQALNTKLPTKAELEELQAKIKELTNSKIESAADLATKAEQLKALHAQAKIHKQQIKDVQQQLAESRDTLKAAVGEVKQASENDWNKLQSMANLSGGGLASISQLLLGDYWGEKIGQLDALYQMAKPYIPSDIDLSQASDDSDSSDVEPNTVAARILPLPSQSYPNVWVKNTRINWLVGGGEATILAQNITMQHSIINASTNFSVDVKQLPNLESFSLNGDFSILQKMVTNATWQAKGFSVKDVSMGGGDGALTLAAALMSSTGTLSLANSDIEQKSTLTLLEPLFTSGEKAEDANKTIKQLSELLSKQDSIPISMKTDGVITSPNVSVSSSLDKIIGDAILGEAKQKLDALQKQLRAQLDETLQKQLAGQADWLEKLDTQGTSADDMASTVEGMLKAKLGSVKDAAKDKLKDSLKSKLLKHGIGG